jgi:hypothetical protein
MKIQVASWKGVCKFYYRIKVQRTLPDDKGDRIFKDFYSLKWDFKSAVIMNHV